MRGRSRHVVRRRWREWTPPDVGRGFDGRYVTTSTIAEVVRGGVWVPSMVCAAEGRSAALGMSAAMVAARPLVVDEQARVVDTLKNHILSTVWNTHQTQT